MSLTAVATAVLIMFLAPQAPASAVDELAWLEGEWYRVTRSGEAVERWARDGDVLVGEGLIVQANETASFESLLIVSMAGELFYIAKPRENPYPVGFRLVEGASGTFVFENTSHDFPQRIIYRRTADDTMTATIEGPGEGGGAPQRIDFEFTRR